MKKNVLIIALLFGTNIFCSSASPAQKAKSIMGSVLADPNKRINPADQQIVYATIMAYRHQKDQILEALKNGQFNANDAKILSEIHSLTTSSVGPLF